MQSADLVRTARNEEIKAVQETIAILKKVHGNEHPLVASSLNNLAVLLWNQDNNSEEAARLGKQALRIREKVFGPDHPSTQQCRRDWG